jgi:NADP-dependent 3-hydroxy acid dehydrogenase YdfG
MFAPSIAANMPVRRINRMSQRTWFITGSFGRHMSEQLLERGDRVAGTARKLEGVDDLKMRYKDRLWLASLDLTDTGHHPPRR